LIGELGGEWGGELGGAPLWNFAGGLAKLPVRMQLAIG
jgi:hypothetical protein